jgi:hypothetical protein
LLNKGNSSFPCGESAAAPLPSTSITSRWDGPSTLQPSIQCLHLARCVWVSADMTGATASRRGVSALLVLAYLLACVSAVTQHSSDKEKVRGVQAVADPVTGRGGL